MENNKCPYLDEYCYVCGHIVRKIQKKDRKNLFTEQFKTAYCNYFDEADLSGANFTPNTVCNSCYTILLKWIQGKSRKFSFMKPVIWVEDTTGHDESRCYACINFRPGLNRQQLKTKVYTAALTATLPVQRPANTDAPKPPSADTVSLLAETVFTNPTDLDDADWIPEIENSAPQPLPQIEMDYIVAKLGLSQHDSEWLTSFLKRRKLTQQNVSATSFRQRQADFQKFYSVDEANTFTYCHDIPGLVKKLGMDYIAGDWRLFIDGSVTSLKAVLLHKKNKKPCIPLGFSTTMKETYEALGEILKKIKYDEHKWKICCDLKVVNILQGIIEKGGYPKYFCFLCNWDSRYKGNQYQCKDWKGRTPELNKQLKLRNEPMIKDLDDILLPPLHMKLGIAGKFVEVVVKKVNGAFDCLKSIFPKLSDEKIKNGTYRTLYFNIVISKFVNFFTFALPIIFSFFLCI